MPRDHLFDDDDRPRSEPEGEAVPPARRSRGWVLLVVAGALVCGGMAAVVRAGWHERREADRPERARSAAADRASHQRAAVSRAEFERAVLGRTAAEVDALFPTVPPPADINRASAMHFYGETLDPTSGWPEGEIRVAFEGGRAVRVVYP